MGQDHQEDSEPRVLVVDDEAAEREGLVALLGQWGHDAYAVATGEDAFEAMEKRRPEVILTDLAERLQYSVAPPA